MLVLVLALTSAVWAPADTMSYVVLNHARIAGEMLVISSGDSVVVKYHQVDRQRGPRSETRYRIVRGVVVGGATWNVPLYGPEPSPRGRPADRFNVDRDTASWPAGDSTRRAPFAPAASFYRPRGGTPYETFLLVQHLLRQKAHTSSILRGGTAKAEVVRRDVRRVAGS